MNNIDLSIIFLELPSTRAHKHVSMHAHQANKYVTTRARDLADSFITICFLSIQPIQFESFNIP